MNKFYLDTDALEETEKRAWKGRSKGRLRETATLFWSLSSSMRRRSVASTARCAASTA